MQDNPLSHLAQWSPFISTAFVRHDEPALSKACYLKPAVQHNPGSQQYTALQ